MQAVKQNVPLLCWTEISGSCCYNVASTEQPADLRPALCWSQFSFEGYKTSQNYHEVSVRSIRSNGYFDKWNWHLESVQHNLETTVFQGVWRGRGKSWTLAMNFTHAGSSVFWLNAFLLTPFFPEQGILTFRTTRIYPYYNGSLKFIFPNSGGLWVFLC